MVWVAGRGWGRVAAEGALGRSGGTGIRVTEPFLGCVGLRLRVIALRLGPMDELLARAWRAAGPLQGWLAWVLHASFSVGVTGVVRA